MSTTEIKDLITVSLGQRCRHNIRKEYGFLWTTNILGTLADPGFVFFNPESASEKAAIQIKFEDIANEVVLMPKGDELEGVMETMLGYANTYQSAAALEHYAEQVLKLAGERFARMDDQAAKIMREHAHAIKKKAEDYRRDQSSGDQVHAEVLAYFYGEKFDPDQLARIRRARGV